MWKRDEGVRPAPPPAAPAPAPPPAPVTAASVPEPVSSATSTPTHARDTVNIGKSVIIKGELSGSEDLAIEGQVEGKIELRQNVLTIGANGKIKAQIFAKQVIVLGEVVGNITASEKVDIRDNGSVDGDIASPRVAIAEGAHFRGSIDMQRNGETKAVPGEGRRGAGRAGRPRPRRQGVASRGRRCPPPGDASQGPRVPLEQEGVERQTPRRAPRSGPTVACPRRCCRSSSPRSRIAKRRSCWTWAPSSAPTSRSSASGSGCKIFVEDLYSDLERAVREGAQRRADDAPRGPHFPGRCQRGRHPLLGPVRLSRKAGGAGRCGAQLARVLAPGGALVGFFASKPASDPLFTRFVIADDRTLVHRPYRGVPPRRSSLQNRDISLLLPGACA